MIRGILYGRLLDDNLVMSIIIEMDINQFTVFETCFDAKYVLQPSWHVAGTAGTAWTSGSWTAVTGSWNAVTWSGTVFWSVDVSVVSGGMFIIMCLSSIFELWQLNTDNNIIVYKPFNFC